MSHSKTPYSPNFPVSQGYAPPPEKPPMEGTQLQGQYPSAPAVPATAPHPPAEGAGYPSALPPPYPVPGAPGPGFSVAQQSYPHSPGYPQPPQHGYPHPGSHGYAPEHGYHQQAPIMHQPSAAPPGGWMNIPQGVPACPPGLEYLTMIDQVLIHQKVELLEAFTGFETNNKYTIKNSIGQLVYYAVEDNDCCTRICCGPARPFDMKIFDNHQREVIHLYRPLMCESCCFPCCLQKMEVSSPPGTVVGTVEQAWSICKPEFLVKNASGDTVLRIKGPLCRYSCFGDVKFNVYSKDGETKVGRITKQWSGLAREVFTDSDYFGITFPMDLDVKVKATLIGASFLIDFMFYEKSGSQERDGAGMI